MVLEGYEKRLLERSALHTLGSLTGHKGENCSDGRRLNHRLWIRDLYRGPSSKEYSNPLISHIKHVPTHTHTHVSEGGGEESFHLVFKGAHDPNLWPQVPPSHRIISRLPELSKVFLLSKDVPRPEAPLLFPCLLLLPPTESRQEFQTNLPIHTSQLPADLNQVSLSISERPPSTQIEIPRASTPNSREDPISHLIAHGLNLIVR